jgi:hypothetical protein
MAFNTTNTLTVFRFTLAYAEKLVADLDEDQLAVPSHDGMDHPAWIPGHVAWGLDFVASLLGKDLLTDDGRINTFGPGSVPVEDRSAYPRKAELVDTMRKTQARAVELLEVT